MCSSPSAVPHSLPHTPLLVFRLFVNYFLIWHRSFLFWNLRDFCDCPQDLYFLPWEASGSRPRRGCWRIWPPGRLGTSRRIWSRGWWRTITGEMDAWTAEVRLAWQMVIGLVRNCGSDQAVALVQADSGRSFLAAALVEIYRRRPWRYPAPAAHGHPAWPRSRASMASRRGACPGRTEAKPLDSRVKRSWACTSR